MFKMLTVAGVLILTLTLWSAARAEEGKQEPSNGTVTGILTSKGVDWIEVKADGEKTGTKYAPYWRGGMPKDGGGYDKATLEAIKKLIVPGRVTVVWEFQERRRIVTVEEIAPAAKEGTVTGTVVAKGENWIDVQPEKAPADRYTPRWLGGLPKDGGGPDKAMLAAFKELAIGDTVELKWLYDERLRAVEVKKVEKAVTPPAAP